MSELRDRYAESLREFEDLRVNGGNEAALQRTARAVMADAAAVIVEQDVLLHLAELSLRGTTTVLTELDAFLDYMGWTPEDDEWFEEADPSPIQQIDKLGRARLASLA